MNNVLSYAKLMSEPNSLEAIREGARVICERRGRYADTISNDVKRIKSEISVIESLIKTIEENSSVLDGNQESELKSLCEQLKKSLKAYLQKAQSLCTRFNNKKIKVLAFGSKSQGKSTFTRLYTGLPESVVAEKAADDDRDKTGALSIISHKKGNAVNNPQITVYFKTSGSILKTINSCISQLSILPNFSLPNCTSRGYNSWNDLSSVLSSVTTKKKAYETLNSLIDPNNQVTDFDPVKSFLKSVFEPESSFADVREIIGVKQISLSELPLYNDMTNTGERRYLSVDHIEIAADLGYNDVFENFEICDTKGISAKAGAMIVEEGVYNDINNSDAAFSIQRVGQGQKATEFYVGLSNSISKVNKESKPERLSTKHFAILNLHKGINNASVDEVVNAINGSQLAKCIYIGSFATKEGTIASYEGVNIDAKNFSTSLVIDMLSKIVNSTKESDDLLIKSCNELVIEINNNQQLLNKFLLQLQNKAEECNIDNILLRNIYLLRTTAFEKLEKLAKSHNIILPDTMEKANYSNATQSQNNNDADDDDDDDDTNEAIVTSEEVVAPMPLEHISSNISKLDPKRNVRIFRMITAHSELKDENIQNMLKKGHASDVAISYILENEIQPLAGSTVYMGPNKKDAIEVDGTPHSLGGFIDSVSTLLFDKIADNINIEYARSQSIDNVTGLRESVFHTMWSELKLDRLYGDFEQQLLLTNEHNDIIKKLNELYCKLKTDGEGSSITPEASYNILITYFRNVDYKPTSEMGSDIVKPIINWAVLKQSIVEVYRRFDFEKRVIEKLADEEKLKRNIFVDLTAVLGSPSFVSGIKGMYLKSPQELLEADIITSDEFEKISNQYKWGVLRNTREQLSSKNVTSLQNIK